MSRACVGERDPPPVEDRAHEQNEPAASLPVRRARGCRPKGPDSRRNDANLASVDAHQPLDLRARELGVREDHGCLPGRLPGEHPAAESFPPSEPFRVRRERDVVNRHGKRHRHPQRCGVCGGEEDVRSITADGPPQVRLLPPRASSFADDTALDRRRRKIERQRLGRVKREPPGVRIRPRRPAQQELSKISPHASGRPEQFARIDADAQGGHCASCLPRRISVSRYACNRRSALIVQLNCFER